MNRLIKPPRLVSVHVRKITVTVSLEVFKLWVSPTIHVTDLGVEALVTLIGMCAALNLNLLPLGTQHNSF